MRRSSLLVATLLIAATAVAQPALTQPPAAKPAAAPALTAAQQAQLKKQDATMAQAALQVAQMIDGRQAGAVWDGASSVAKQAVSRDAFVKQVDADRARLGAVSRREIGAISRTQSEGGKVPAGNYVNVNYRTTFAKAAQPVRELVSFHLDSDHKWRVAGYTLR